MKNKWICIDCKKSFRNSLNTFILPKKSSNKGKILCPDCFKKVLKNMKKGKIEEDVLYVSYCSGKKLKKLI
ncbi:MAG: hypothetical protein NTZ83_02280 [Candidatus Pacearchaeota archaeon]|nr:hypothetical protein [Candidatus Pacearchaeota archaeon]